MAKLVANRYASSLFEAGLELEKIEDFYGELESVGKVFHNENKLFQILTHPRVSKNEKKSLIETIFEKKISKEMINFLYIIIDKRRESYLFEIIQEYKAIFNEFKEIVDVVAITAVPMDEQAKNKLSIVLKNKLNKNIQLSNEVDKSIIGGVLLKMNDKVVDSTLTSQLKSMEAVLKSVSL
ncbi:MAG: F0F1 ATP synthase subunit delta [Tissierellaceae bacterium]